MAGEAVSGRYGAARHAVADEGGSRHHPASEDRSLVDRLLGEGEEQAFDWGWGDPASGDLVTDREPLHDIPELWGTQERTSREAARPDGAEEKPFPTPRLHGENSFGDNRAEDRRDDRGDDESDWSDRSLDDPGSDDWGAPALDVEDRRPDVGAAFARAFGDPAPGRRDRAAHDPERGGELEAVGAESDDRELGGDPLDALSTGRVHAENGPLGDAPRDRGAPDRAAQDDVPMDGDHAGSPAGADPLDRSPLAPPLPNRDPYDGERSGLEASGREPIPTGPEPRALFDRSPLNGDPLNGDPVDRDPLNRDALNRNPFDHDSPDRNWPDRDRRPGGGPPADHLPSNQGPFERSRGDGDRFGGGSPRETDRFEREPQERGANDPDALATEPPERKLVDADPRLRRWADRDRPSGAPRIGRPPSQLADEPATPDRAGEDRAGEDRVGEAPRDADRRNGDQGSDLFTPDLFGADVLGAAPDGRNRPDPGPDPFADPAFTESVLTGRIRVTDADAPGPDRPLQEQPGGEPRDTSEPGPDPLAVTPDPTTAFTAVPPARPSAPELPLEEYTARRRAAEQAAASAEEAAASAAERASAAIAAAARAAEEAEAAAEAATKAAEKANDAAEAEARAIADAAARGETPAQQVAPEPPTQAVPLIAPARAPGRRPPPRRPAGPPPRGARPEEPGRPGGPPPRAAHQNAPLRGGTDGEATAVLTGLDALRDPVRPRRQEPAPAEVTTIAPRRQAAETAREADDADDVDDAEHDDEPEERGLAGRLTSRPVIAAVGVGAVLVLAAIVAIFTTSEPEAAPAEAAPAAVSAPVAQQPEPTAQPVDLDGRKAVAFLTALRDADIPTSSSGQAEVEAADAICSQLDQGADEAQLARSVPAVLPNVTRGQASDVVDYAKQFYC
jgi:hypothetical protein